MKNILEIKNLDISFGGVHAVNDLSFNVIEGEILGLIGPNGSGKSTTINLISGLYKASKGQIILDGVNISRKSITDRVFLGIGRTFQSPRPFLNISVYDNIYTSALLHNKSKAEAKLQTEQILDMTGFASSSNIMCAKLPVEKRKWLDMARLLPARPKILMLDECLAGLNPSEMNDSLVLVKKINASGVTILFIEHVMAAVTQICNRVVVLDNGRLLSEGIPDEVMKEEAVIRAYLGGVKKNA